LARLSLVAQAGRDRAVFIGKRGDRDDVLSAAHGMLYLTTRAWLALSCAALCIVALLAALGHAIVREIARQWRG
jgi:hypothetical protein